MKNLFLAVAISLTLFGCNNSNDKKETTKSVDTVVAPISKDTVTTVTPLIASEFPATFTPGKTFTADKADLHEYLKVQELSDKKIAYEIYMINGGCAEFKVQGVAVLKEGDAESDSDEKNNGYFVAEYVDDVTDKCGIYIRIGIDKGYTNRAKFNITDCDKTCKNESETLFSSK